jgi:hypothetical protein
MFFQDASSTTPGADKPENFNINDVRKGLDKLSNQIIGTFTQGRERVFEFNRAITDSLPGVRSLGGDIKNVGAILQEVAIASRRNVVANEEEIKGLFAASKVLGISAQELSSSFLDVGVGIESISDALEGSIDYVRGIGGNARQVMKDVQANMEQMNRYQFEGGVLGLTKMAAQASMLRFDMNQTFQLAEKVLSPEGAVETAAAFQRLGLAVGNLADPFALMNASINDPGSLQDSLVEVAQQFTYFDEKTKTFKINPQGVLTLKELESQTGVSAKEMSKLGLAAAELDQRLSAVNAAGLSIVNEEDKQYLANIAKMEGGSYKVTLEDGTKKELSDLTQPQFDKLIEEQKTGPKTVEELQRAQLTVDEIMQSDIAAIKYAVLGGILTDKNIQDLLEGTRTIADITGEQLNKTITTQGMREFSEENLTKSFRKDIEDLIKGGASPTEVLPSLMESAGTALGGLSTEAIRIVTEASGRISAELQKEGGLAGSVSTNLTSLIENLTGNLKEILPKTGEGGAGGTTTEDDYWTNLTVEGSSGANRNLGTVADQVREQKSLIELLGEIKVNVNFQDLPAGLTTEQKEQITKTFSDKINAQNFKDYIVNVTRPDNAFRGGGTATY